VGLQISSWTHLDTVAHRGSRAVVLSTCPTFLAVLPSPTPPLHSVQLCRITHVRMVGHFGPLCWSVVPDFRSVVGRKNRGQLTMTHHHNGGRRADSADILAQHHHRVVWCGVPKVAWNVPTRQGQKFCFTMSVPGSRGLTRAVRTELRPAEMDTGPVGDIGGPRNKHSSSLAHQRPGCVVCTEESCQQDTPNVGSRSNCRLDARHNDRTVAWTRATTENPRPPK
jgi:hypothetical protein